ncbi:TetR/AcrR family transcriptional regulator [Leifsonia sp. 21MFCrub1.1]|uniref:TetR/AcrR family transcriptional regulator n=1 Tax=Leifsonia sp. 21MFCrub1.1 TaxID=1798223 RepID=UPI000892915D|nr:TetR/AcrR family transcriptional regulator [Leifsonia sp. 21MFCrub1.1]SEA37047.1 DNA-binding transcriptional regulator, AcrR family [Leifsonia sp. 21MFCrub1.1]
MAASTRTPASAIASTDTSTDAAPGRAQRSDARQNVTALIAAAKSVFAESGVEAPVRAIAERAGVGVGTLYRHFPLRSDLISAVFRAEIDACAAAATEIEAASPPGEALDRWIMRYTQFVGTKRGLAAALHSGDPAYEPLADYFSTHLAPTLERLLASARSAGDIEQEVDAVELLGAVANLCHGAGPHGGVSPRADRMVRILLAGLRAPADDV